MKEIMTKASSTEDQGVPLFTYSPADASIPALFSLRQPLSALRASLLKSSAGQELTTIEIYKRHSVGRPFIKKNYKETLLQMEEDGIIRERSL